MLPFAARPSRFGHMHALQHANPPISPEIGAPIYWAQIEAASGGPGGRLCGKDIARGWARSGHLRLGRGALSKQNIRAPLWPPIAGRGQHRRPGRSTNKPTRRPLGRKQATN